ncbi:MAG: hypothetical protein MI974_08750 [Chitinophagales bacterium]|nr:hypothetical protein [Chitinophagales bacterium]
MHIKFRKKIKGPEAKLIEDFLQNIEIFYQDGLEYDFFIEPYAEIGIPDIVIIGWDKKMLTKWSPKRTDLGIKDIKIMHHISSFKKRGVAIIKLKEQLGYPELEMEKSLSLLSEANLINKTERRVFAKDLDRNFFIRHNYYN